MKIVRFDDAPTFVPGGHDGVVNRALVGEEWHGVGAVSVWHGSFQPGANAGLHAHDDAVQVYVVLAGEFVVSDGETEHRLRQHDTAIVPAGELHNIATEDGSGVVLVISTPALR